MKWNCNEWQGRTEQQVRDNYKITFWSLTLIIATIIAMSLLYGCSSSKNIDCDAYSKIEN